MLWKDFVFCFFLQQSKNYLITPDLEIKLTSFTFNFIFVREGKFSNAYYSTLSYCLLTYILRRTDLTPSPHPFHSWRVHKRRPVAKVVRYQSSKRRRQHSGRSELTWTLDWPRRRRRCRNTPTPSVSSTLSLPVSTSRYLHFLLVLLCSLYHVQRYGGRSLYCVFFSFLSYSLCSVLYKHGNQINSGMNNIASKFCNGTTWFCPFSPSPVLFCLS